MFRGGMFRGFRVISLPFSAGTPITLGTTLGLQGFGLRSFRTVEVGFERLGLNLNPAP